MLRLTFFRIYRRIKNRPGIGILTVVILLMIGILGNAVTFYAFEHNAQGELTFGDSLWYSVISITTIGYGDYSARNIWARLGTVVFTVTLGLLAFSVFLGMIVDWGNEFLMRGRTGMATVVAKDHILLVNYPSTDRVRQMVREIRSDPRNKNREIVIISDQIESLPFSDENVLFVRGSILDEETYRRAKIENATMAIVLATSYGDASSDALVASAVAVIEAVKPEIYSVAECLNVKHKILFSSVRCDAIVYSMQMSTNLLVHEAQDPGISQLAAEITSSQKQPTLYSVLVTESIMVNYSELAKRMLDRQVNIISVNRDGESTTAYFAMHPEENDRVIYTAAARLSWPDFLAGI